MRSRWPHGGREDRPRPLSSSWHTSSARSASSEGLHSPIGSARDESSPNSLSAKALELLPDPTDYDLRNSAVRQQIADIQNAEYAAALKLALGTLGPGWQPWMKLVLIPSDHHVTRDTTPMAVAYKVYRGESLLPEPPAAPLYAIGLAAEWEMAGRSWSPASPPSRMPTSSMPAAPYRELIETLQAGRGRPGTSSGSADRQGQGERPAGGACLRDWAGSFLGGQDRRQHWSSLFALQPAPSPVWVAKS